MPPPVDPKRIKTAADRAAVAAGCWFDERAALRPVAWGMHHFRVPKGRLAGRPWRPLPWQREALETLFGWKRPDGSRRFRSAFIFIPKKNGKTPFAAIMAAYMLIADGEPSPQVFSVASDRDQAGLVYADCAKYLDTAPELAERIRRLDSLKRMECRANGGQFRVLSSDVEGKDGIDAHCVIFDELHTQKRPDLWGRLKYATRARRQPLFITITTAGGDKVGVCWEEYERAKRVLGGGSLDWTHYALIFEAPDGCALDDMNAWRAANPSMGITLDPMDALADIEEARGSPVKEAILRRLRLNQWCGSVSAWVDVSAWARCAHPRPLESLIGRPCWLGLDLAQRLDLTALAGIWQLNDDWPRRYYAQAWHWLPKTTLEAAKADHRYREFAASGEIVATDTVYTDYAGIRATIAKLRGDGHDIQTLMADPREGTQLFNALRDEDGLPVIEHSQGYAAYTDSVKTLEALILAGDIEHAGGKCLSWQVGNAKIAFNALGECRPAKNRCKEKIDGLVALLMATSGAMRSPADAGGDFEIRRF